MPLEEHQAQQNDRITKIHVAFDDYDQSARAGIARIAAANSDARSPNASVTLLTTEVKATLESKAAAYQVALGNSGLVHQATVDIGSAQAGKVEPVNVVKLEPNEKPTPVVAKGVEVPEK